MAEFFTLPFGKQTKLVGNGQCLPLVGAVTILGLVSCEIREVHLRLRDGLITCVMLSVLLDGATRLFATGEAKAVDGYEVWHYLADWG